MNVIAQDPRSITQRTLDVLQDEWTRPLRAELEEAHARGHRVRQELDAINEALGLFFDPEEGSTASVQRVIDQRNDLYRRLHG